MVAADSLHGSWLPDGQGVPPTEQALSGTGIGFHQDMDVTAAPSRCLSGSATVVIVKLHSWVGLCIASLIWQLPQGPGFQARPSSDPLGPVSEVDGVFSSRDLSAVSGGQPKGSNSILQCFVDCLDISKHQL